MDLYHEWRHDVGHTRQDKQIKKIRCKLCLPAMTGMWKYLATFLNWSYCNQSCFARMFLIWSCQTCNLVRPGGDRLGTVRKMWHRAGGKLKTPPNLADNKYLLQFYSLGWKIRELLFQKLPMMLLVL